MICLTAPYFACYINRAWRGHPSFKLLSFTTEEKIVRTRITLECTECKQRNYNTMKDKKTHPDRMEISKYCRFCKKHTVHRETK